MSKTLLIETHTLKSNPVQLTENVNSENGNLMVEGILTTAEVKNGNGRYSSVINLQNVSHLVTEYHWDGDNVIGKIEILPTPSGNILKELIRNGITVGVSSRGMGSLEQNGSVMEVQDDFELLCWDFVSTPSNPGSFMSVLQEGKETITYDYTKVNNVIREILCSKGSCPVS